MIIVQIGLGEVWSTRSRKIRRILLLLFHIHDYVLDRFTLYLCWLDSYYGLNHDLTLTSWLLPWVEHFRVLYALGSVLNCACRWDSHISKSTCRFTQANIVQLAALLHKLIVKMAEATWRLSLDGHLGCWTLLLRESLLLDFRICLDKSLHLSCHRDHIFHNLERESLLWIWCLDKCLA
jgi:hypothetical protein